VSIASDVKLLKEVGEALYGSRWQSELARRIGISDRSVRRWVAGTDDVSDAAWRGMMEELGTRAIDLEVLRNRIRDRLLSNQEKGL
jgi:hypothetical protein